MPLMLHPTELRRLFLEFAVPDRETLYRAIAFGHRRGALEARDAS